MEITAIVLGVAGALLVFVGALVGVLTADIPVFMKLIFGGALVFASGFLLWGVSQP